jgi:hypothetical protein
MMAITVEKNASATRKKSSEESTDGYQNNCKMTLRRENDCLSHRHLKLIK